MKRGRFCFVLALLVAGCGGKLLEEVNRETELPDPPEAAPPAVDAGTSTELDAAPDVRDAAPWCFMCDREAGPWACFYECQKPPEGQLSGDGYTYWCCYR